MTPWPPGIALADEGAANHTRLCAGFAQPGLELFVFGKSVLDKSLPTPSSFPARQTREACQAIARRHRLTGQAVRLVQQNPDVIDRGVFHNDVISVGTRNVLLTHEDAFLGGVSAIREIESAYRQLTGQPLLVWCAQRSRLSVNDAVASYLFNSQLLVRPDEAMTLLCPTDVENLAAARAGAEDIVAADNPVDEVRYIDLRQSMNNGGGPACLRLRVVLDEDQLGAVHPGVLFTNALYAKLRDWVNRNYPGRVERQRSVRSGVANGSGQGVCRTGPNSGFTAAVVWSDKPCPARLEPIPHGKQQRLLQFGKPCRDDLMCVSGNPCRPEEKTCCSFSGSVDTICTMDVLRTHGGAGSPSSSPRGCHVVLRFHA